MKTVGIIAEYNPLHTGHAYQLSYVRDRLEADYIIVVMSGDFVQRGTPALLSKQLRAEMALRTGADLVLELPTALSTASAEFFADGGVQLLDGLGIVDELCFGCESPDAPLFMEIADTLLREPSEYQRLLREALCRGISFPAARSQALVGYLNRPELSPLLSSPNCILGIEYCKALLRRKSSIQPHPLKREGCGYHASSPREGCFPSASAIRTRVLAGEQEYQGLIPNSCLSLFTDSLCRQQFLTESDLDFFYIYRLLLENMESLCSYADLTPELANRILRLRGQYKTFTDFVDLLKTKNLTRTRIQRGLLHMLLQITGSPSLPGYARVLGFRRESARLLSEIKKQGKIPLLTKPAAASSLLTGEDLVLLEQTTFASNLYQMLLSQKSGQPFLHEYGQPMVF